MRWVYYGAMAMSVAAGICAFGYCFLLTAARWSRSRRRPSVFRFVIAIVVLAASLATLTLVVHVSTQRARGGLAAWLADLSDTYTVEVNGEAMAQPAMLVEALRHVDARPYHHSHPTTRVHVDIDDGGRRLSLLLARDSERAAEYWVYIAPGSGIDEPADGGEIGAISTFALDNVRTTSSTLPYASSSAAQLAVAPDAAHTCSLAHPARLRRAGEPSCSALCQFPEP